MEEPGEFLAPKLPIIFRGKREDLTSEQRMNLIILAPDSFHCTERPSPVENVAFLVDRSKLAHPNDWVVHDKGSFRNYSRTNTLISSEYHKPKKRKPAEEEVSFTP